MKANGCDNETATTITFCYTVYNFLVELEDQCQYGHFQSVHCPASARGDLHDQFLDLQKPFCQVHAAPQAMEASRPARTAVPAPSIAVEGWLSTQQTQSGEWPALLSDLPRCDGETLRDG